MHKKIILACLALMLVNCTEKKPVIEGKRIAIFGENSLLNANGNINKLVFNKSLLADGWYNNKFILNNQIDNIKLKNDFKKSLEYKLSSAILNSDKIVYPLLSGKILLVKDEANKLIAYSTDNMKKIWEFNLKLPKDVKGGGIVIDAEIAYLTDGANSIYALDINNGDIIWHKKIDNVVKSTPVIGHGNLYILTQDNHTYAVNQATGEIVWFHIGAGEVYGDIRNASIALDEDIVIAPYSSGEIVGLNPEDGEVIWSNSVSFISSSLSLSIQAFQIPPLLDDNHVFAATNSGVLFGINKANGSIAWKLDLPRINEMWQTKDYLFVLYQNNYLACIEKNSKKVIWNKNIAENIAEYQLRHQLMYKTKDDNKQFEKLKIKHKTRLEAADYHNLIMVNGELLIASNEGLLVNISPLNGNINSVANIMPRLNGMIIQKTKIMLFNAQSKVTYLE